MKTPSKAHLGIALLVGLTLTPEEIVGGFQQMIGLASAP